MKGRLVDVGCDTTTDERLWPHLSYDFCAGDIVCTQRHITIKRFLQA
jgi:hypothetical protein